MNKQQIIESLFGFNNSTFYRWKSQNRLIIVLLEKYFTQEELEEFLETGVIQKQELIKGYTKEEREKGRQNKEKILKILEVLD
jgi:hypothetical protein